MSENTGRQSPGARLILSSALVTVQGSIQLLGGFAAIMKGNLSESFQQAIGHPMAASVAAHLSARNERVTVPSR